MTNRPKRITERTVAEGEDAELAALIGGALRVGTIEGVRVDFRHPDLPPDWEALPYWNVWGPPPENAGIIFPSEAAHGVEALRKAKIMKDDTPIFARPGDTLTIERVDQSRFDAPFDHPHDRETRLAHLLLTRPTGEKLRPSGPLAFYGVGRVKRAGSREAFDHILDRALREAGVDAFPAPPTPLDAIGWSPWQQPLPVTALWFAEQAHKTYFDLLASLDGREQAKLRIMLDSAVLAGFLLAKAEARKAEGLGAGPLAGAKAAGEATRNKRWIEAAAAHWAAYPDASLYAAANAIRAEYEAQGNVERAIAHLCPSTSKSYANKRCVRARERRA